MLISKTAPTSHFRHQANLIKTETTSQETKKGVGNALFSPSKISNKAHTLLIRTLVITALIMKSTAQQRITPEGNTSISIIKSDESSMQKSKAPHPVLVASCVAGIFTLLLLLGLFCQSLSKSDTHPTPPEQPNHQAQQPPTTQSAIV